MVRLGDDSVQPGQRAAGDRQRDPEDHEALEVVAGRVGAAADPEGEAPVGCGIADRGEQQRDQVRRLGAERTRASA